MIILYSQINHHSDPFLCPKVYNIILIISTMEAEAEYLLDDHRKQYVLTDIMRKRKKDKQAVESKIKNKIALKGKRKKSETALKNPEKFIKQYRAQQKSYTHYRLKVQPTSFRISRTRPLTSRLNSSSLELANSF